MHTPSLPALETPPPLELDVRPLLKAGEEPFQAIMQAASTLADGQSLRLLAPFRPVPLFSVMANRGFAASDRALAGGDWEVVFSPVATPPEDGLALSSSPGAIFWGEPALELDLSDLDPPEPMMRILEALEEMRPGEVLFALLAREPVFLFTELAKRRHEWAGNFDADGAMYRLLVRHGGGQAGAHA